MPLRLDIAIALVSLALTTPAARAADLIREAAVRRYG